MSVIKEKNLLIRVDAGVNIGYGHAMRCLALAQAWQDEKGSVTFVMAEDTSSFSQRLQEEKMEIIPIEAEPGSKEDAVKTTEIAKEKKASWIVVDGYHFDANYQQNIKDAGLPLLFIDDYGHAEYYVADIVLNQNIHATEEFYLNRAPYTKLLLGTRYVLLRREFLKWQGHERKIPNVACNVLVTMGGSDPENVTLKILQALNEVEINGLEAIAVVGGSNPHYETLEEFAQNARVTIHLEKNAQNMPELMAWADVAVANGGTTTYELAFMGVPLIIIVLAENQRPIAEGLHKNGVAINLGWHKNIDLTKITQTSSDLLSNKNLRKIMSQFAKTILEGKGATLTLNLMRQKYQNNEDII